MLGIARIELQGALHHLDLAIERHQQWYESIVKILVCRLPFDPLHASEDAHRRCGFGQWYYTEESRELKERTGFLSLEAEHERMHRIAAGLLRGMAEGREVDLNGYESFAQSLTDLHAEFQTLKRELEHAIGDLDPLTGAYNRVGMLPWLREQQEMVRRNILSCGVAMVDLDHFKSVNDRYGHLVGDRVLLHASRFLLEHVRPYDRVFRYGGEEFVLGFPDADLATCHTLVDRLREGLANTPVTHEGQTIPCRVSCGVALLQAELPLDQVIERADRAMYSAKKAGRNRTHLWEPGLPPA